MKILILLMIFVTSCTSDLIEVDSDENYCKNCDTPLNVSDRYYIPCYRYAYHIGIPDCEDKQSSEVFRGLITELTNKGNE